MFLISLISLVIPHILKNRITQRRNQSIPRKRTKTPNPALNPKIVATSSDI
jgi:hypothetical protein